MGEECVRRVSRRATIDRSNVRACVPVALQDTNSQSPFVGLETLDILEFVERRREFLFVQNTRAGERGRPGRGRARARLAETHGRAHQRRQRDGAGLLPGGGRAGRGLGHRRRRALRERARARTQARPQVPLQGASFSVPPFTRDPFFPARVSRLQVQSRHLGEKRIDLCSSS